MVNKYALSDIAHPEITGLVRIIALRDIPKYGVLKGDFGGFVSGHHNLAQSGSSWIADNAVVKDSAHVCDDALICHSGFLQGQDRVVGSAIVH